MKVVEEQFKLKKFSHYKGISKYVGELSFSISEDTHTQKINNQDTRYPSPDLLDPFSDYLKDVCIEALGLCDFMSLRKGASDENIAAFDKLNVLFQKYYDNVKKGIRVTGIEFTGSNASAGIVLTGKRKVASGKLVDFTTPSITLSASTYGIEEALAEVGEKIKSEVFSYVFMNKVSDVEIPFDEDEDED